MKPYDVEFFQLWSERDDYRKKLQETEQRIKNTNFSKPIISFSGGKDSLVTMSIFCKQFPDTEILHWDYGRYYIPRNFHEEIKQIMKSHSKNIRIETSEKYETQKRHAVNVLGSEFMGRLIPRLKREGYDVSVTGIRKLESKKRSFKNLFQIGYGNMYEFCPIFDWRTEDVWAYIISEKLRYLSYYDQYSKIIPILDIRFTTLFDSEFAKFGSENIDAVLNWREKQPQYTEPSNF